MKKIFVATVCSMALALGLVGCNSPSAENTDDQAQTVEGQTDEASVTRARELMENMFAASADENVTIVSAVQTNTNIDGVDYNTTSTTTIMKDLSGDEPHYYKSLVTEPASENDSAYYIDGINGIVEIGDQRIPVEYEADKIDEVVNQEAATENVRAYYDYADEISYYEEDGTEVVQVHVNPTTLLESGLFEDTFTNIDNCVAEYTFDAEGRLNVFINTIEGTVMGTDGAENQVRIETRAVYSDFDTTEVPALPEPNVTEDGTEAEAESGE